FFFFFQAEDGIRDLTVTGVQTCALPILFVSIDTNSAWMAQELNKLGIWVRRRVAVGDVPEEIWNALNEESTYADIILITGGLGRSEERRVGKECRSRWLR